ncbi:Disease resistance protein RPM1 [Sesamum alatum]|uniref:Disease resistance protein RPM1 n=1 Tax=Sesamum alatum TaxID=300844 RepID=A0AAE2CZD9_9LAMI|nr:Disease resistance protein RPM1 [Sesamum alatum]
MAELAVAAALGSVQIALATLQIVVPLRSKFNNQTDLQNEIKGLESWLRSMKAFTEDNDGREGSRTLEDQMEKVGDIACDIEDVLDEFLLHSPPYTFHNHAITRNVHSFAHNVYHGFPLRGISDKIANIKRNITEIKPQREAFPDSYSSSKPSSSSRTRIQHQVSPLLLDDEMVGYEEPKKKFILRLVDREEGLVRLAVVGPGGSGKTTFVKNIFWKRRIRGQFDCHAWVHVSQHFNVEELFINMLKQFCYSRKEPYPTDDSLSTLAKLQNYLAGKRYIVVLDDIWRKEHWDEIKNAFPDAFLGCRVVVTTTFSTVASVCASSSDLVYSLTGLDWLEGWKLFCRKAFPDSNGECPSELKDSSIKIVKRCEGLPFAIVAVGGALAQKPRLPNEWEKFHNSLGSEIRSDSKLSVISNALLPGYMDLSSNLKSCFLYFSIFPEDHSVKRGRLIRLWVAERFATATDDKTAEVAEDYLDELIHRNLVHVSNWDFQGHHQSHPSQHLSLVIVDTKGRILKHLKKLSQLRKLGLTGLRWEQREALSACVEQMQNLRTLDLCSASKAEYLELGEMKNPPHTLQRLYLKGRLRELPWWISSLNNLLRIGLKWSKMMRSPLQAFGSLPNLVELQLIDCYVGEELIFDAYGFKKLKNLLIEEFYKLHTVVIQDGAMPDLKEISLRKCPELSMFPLGIHNLAKVEELTLYDMAEELVARLRRNSEDRAMVRHIPVIHSFTLNNGWWSFENLS